MSNTTRSLTAGAIAMMAVTSCSLPPREAWRQIQTDGLIPFVATQWSSDSTPTATGQPKPQMMAQQTPKKQTPASSVSVPATVASTATANSTARTAPNTTPSPVMIDAKNLPKAQVVPGLAGYVRTPYTNPPRLVDVRGMNAGSKVVCPFTNKPFLVPAGVAPEQPKVAAAPAPIPAPTPTPAPQAPKTTVTSAPVTTVPTTPTKVAAMTKPQPTAPTTPVTPQVKPQPQAPTTPAPTKPAPIATTPPAKAETQEIPFGNPIAGRPGFVNSPYAAKHQLVDVTGLPVGMEVKCPYTGKLFRVPPQADAQGKAPAQSTASPEKK